nr:putative glutamate carboxypeptidase [Quercus suber]
MQQEKDNAELYDAMSSSEQTPLLQRIPVAEQHQRYPHVTVSDAESKHSKDFVAGADTNPLQFRRYCTLALIAIPLLTLAIVGVSVAITGSEPFDDATTLVSILPHSSWPESNGLSYTALKKLFLSTPDAGKARDWSNYYTAGPHLAGKNRSQAQWTADKWAEWGVHTSDVVSYEVYLNYPISHRLALLKDGKTDFEATLEEDVLEDDPTSGLKHRIPAFHGYSASGNVTGQLVYANYGSFQDYEELQKAGISLKDKIVIARYGGIFRGLKVKRAEELGAIGIILYSDPGDDGEITEENGYDSYPNGPARNPSSLQRGSVDYLSIAPGDPTTVGYPSLPGCERQSTDGNIPKIPSLPLSYTEALPFLKALNGHGPNATTFSPFWRTGGLSYKGVHYNVGPSPSSITVNLVNEQEYVTTPLWNVIGVINGSITDEVLVIGNHRDAWIAGGAADPNSGSAALNEVVRSFGAALEQGWKPLRTIVFASWDGEEYALVGSTEWVEEYVPWLSASTIAYINVDVGTAGTRFTAAAAPLLNQALYNVTAEVQSPNQTIDGQTVRDVWNGHIGTMGSGSDFTAFQDFAGIPSIDVGFKGTSRDPVYHYHSNYDSFHWMETYGDPGFEYHVTIAKVILLLAAKLVEEPVVQFNATDYALGLGRYLDSVKAAASSSSSINAVSNDTFASLDRAIGALLETSQIFDTAAFKLSETIATMTAQGIGHAAGREKLYEQVRAVNSKYKMLERQFLYEAGLDSRPWFKHTVFAPGLWTGYAGATFPGLVEAIDDGNKTQMEKWVDIIEQRVDGASGLLEL